MARQPIVGLVCAVAACQTTEAVTPPAAEVVFEDVAAERGLTGAQWHPPDALSDLPCGQAEMMTGGAAVADVDGDGDLDIYLPRLRLPGQFFRNRGDGTFEEQAGRLGLDASFAASGAVFADVNGDGRLDLLVTTVGPERPRLYIQKSSGAFVDEGGLRGLDVLDPGERCASLFSATFGDAEGDGDLDLVVVEWQDSPAVTLSRYLENDGMGVFADKTAERGLAMTDVAGFSATFVDFDGNGWQDLLVAADWSTSKIFANDNGAFADVTVRAGAGTDENGMGSTVGDFNGDGRLDWFVSSIYDNRTTCPGRHEWDCSGNRLYLGGEGGTVDATDTWGVRDGGWGWGAAMADYDLDGDLDLLQTGGFYLPFDEASSRFFNSQLDYFVGSTARLWRNEGGGSQEVSAVSGWVDKRAGRALVPLDFDRDGDLDFLVTHSAGPPALMENRQDTTRGWVSIRLSGPCKNRFGVGARIRLRAEADGPWQHRWILAGDGFLSSAPYEAHFGVGTRETVHRLEVDLPGFETVIRGEISSGQVVDVVVAGGCPSVR